MLVVCKVGGSLDGDGADVLANVLDTCIREAVSVVLVHGGGPAITRALDMANIRLPFVDGLRQTTDEAMPVIEAALMACNERLCDSLTSRGIPVKPLVDGESVRARSIGMRRTGDVRRVDSTVLREALETVSVPVLPPYGRDEQNVLYNLNADTVASHVASSLLANRLLFFTDVSGIYSDFERGARLYDTTAAELRHLKEQNAFEDGMRPKVAAMLHAYEERVEETWVLDGRDEMSIRYALGFERQAPSQRGTRVQNVSMKEKVY